MGLREVIGGVREVAATMLQMAVRKEQEKKSVERGSVLLPAISLVCPSRWMSSHTHSYLYLALGILTSLTLPQAGITQKEVRAPEAG